MKWLLILLLVLNAAFFGWQYSRQEESGAQTPIALPLDGTVKTLTLLSEAGQQPPAAPPPESKPQPAVAKTPATICYTLGPFASSEDAQRVGIQIMGRGFKPSLREGTATEQREYWLDLDANDGNTVSDSLWQELSGSFPGEFSSIQQQPRPCR
ncbi:MAG: hypothetical protein M3A44_05040 [Gammaproteobacteria bacterium]